MKIHNEVFPIILYARRDCGSSSYDFRKVFYSVKPKDFTFYAYDVVIRSRTKVTFNVFDMADNFYGGVGKKIAEYEAKVTSDMTKPHIDKKLMYLAEMIRAEEIEKAEKALINAHYGRLKKLLNDEELKMEKSK